MSPRAIQDRAYLAGYSMPFVQESATIFTNGGAGYTALVEPRVVKTVTEFAEALKASAAVISTEPAPAIMQLILETKSLVTGDKARVPVEWARADEYVTGNRWYIALAAWSNVSPATEIIRSRALSVDVETYFPQQAQDASTANMVMLVVRPRGSRFRVGSLMAALGAPVTLINKHPMEAQSSVDLVKELDTATDDFRGSMKDLAITLSDVPDSLVGLVDSGIGVLPSAFNFTSALIPVALVGVVALGGYWLYTRTRSRTRAWRTAS
jgi:hypothetical protein